MRPELCLEALRLSRMLSALVPDDPEVWGLEALLELQGSRTAAPPHQAGPPGLLQGGIPACHARARRPEDTDWGRMASLYDLLVTVSPSAVVEVNRAVAHGR